MSESNVSPEVLTLVGAIAAAVTGGGGLWVGARKNRTDGMTAIVNAALAVSDRNAQDATDCEQRLAAQDAKLAELTLRVEACETKHAKVLRLVEQVGAVVPPDLLG